MVWNETHVVHGEPFELLRRLEIERVALVVFRVSCSMFLHVFKGLQRFAYGRVVRKDRGRQASLLIQLTAPSQIRFQHFQAHFSLSFAGSRYYGVGVLDQIPLDISKDQKLRSGEIQYRNLGRQIIARRGSVTKKSVLATLTAALDALYLDPKFEVDACESMARFSEGSGGVLRPSSSS